MISGFGMLAPLLAVLVWADRKLTIDEPGGRRLPRALMNCTRCGDRQPGIRLTGIRRAPYSIRTPLVKGPPGALAVCAFQPDRFGRMPCCRLTQAAGLGRGCAFRALPAEEALHAWVWDR